MKTVWTQRSGFTIVELLIVIVVIAVIAAITIVAYSGIQSRAKTSKLQSDISSLRKAVEAYNAEFGTYPITAVNLNPNWGDATGRTDSGCNLGSKQVDWIPNIKTNLPQSKGEKGVGGSRGCYIYASDGVSYILSAWNMLEVPQIGSMYRRLGFREMDDAARNPFYICNLNVIGGDSGGYNIANDYYKYSITASNITSSTCNETPPSGA